MAELKNNLRDSLNSIGERIAFVRNKLDINQKDFATKLGYKVPGAISRIEKNLSPPSMSSLILMAQAFNVDLHWLITGKPFPQSNPWDSLTTEVSRVIQERIDDLHERLQGLIQKRKELDNCESDTTKEDGAADYLREIISKLRDEESEFYDKIIAYRKLYNTLIDAGKVFRANDLQRPQK